MWFQSQIHSIQLVCQLTVRRHPIIQITQMMMIQFCGCLFFRDPHRWRWSNDHSFQSSSIVIPAPRIVQNKETEFSRKSAVRGETRKEISKKDWLPKLTKDWLLAIEEHIPSHINNNHDHEESSRGGSPRYCDSTVNNIESFCKFVLGTGDGIRSPSRNDRIVSKGHR